MAKPVSRLFGWRLAIRASDLSSTQKLVAIVLSLYMNQEGARCFPSTIAIARDCSLSRSTVSAAVAELERRGFVSVIRGFNRSNHYFAQFPPVSDRTKPPSSRTTRASGIRTGGVRQDEPSTSPNESINKSPNKSEGNL